MRNQLHDKKTGGEPANDTGTPGQEDFTFELIRFDRKSKIFVGVCLFLFLLFVALKLHNSSIPLWNANMNDGGDEKRGLLAGKPLPVRSDEWLVVASFTLAQEKDTLPVSNQSLGYGKTPLIMGLPTNSMLSKVKPLLWGYYFLGEERGFSWQWNFKIFPFLIVSFLLLMLFTKNNFNVSLFGSIWLFLSSAIQWWSINTEIFTLGFSCLISLIYILYSRRTRLIIFNGVIFLLASYSFITILYPAYQVPFGYFLITLFLGFAINRRGFKTIFSKPLVRVPVLFLSGLILLTLLYLFYKECKDTIQVISHTVYPGRRNETGGGFTFISLFKDNYSWFLNDSYYPPKWGNICELSSFLMLSPVATILVVYSYLKTRKVNRLLVPILIYQVILYVWLFWGFPEFLAKLTLFNASPAKRTFFIFGFTNIIFTLLYLGQFERIEDKTSSWQKNVIVFITVFLLAFGINYSLNKQSGRFFSIMQIFNVTILFAILNWLVVYFKERKIYQSLFFSGCFFFIASNIFINPLSRGLSPYLENKTYKAVTEIENKDPGNGWVVFGHLTAPDFLKAAGADCLNGVQYAPPLAKLHVLDSSLKNDEVYDRYAHIVFFPLVTGKDSVRFSLDQADRYSVQIDPCSPRLKQIGVKYFMFAYKPSDAEVRCMSLVSNTPGFFIYKRNDP
jgi:hypothetical protein